jgi:hypothetical protein
MLSHSRPDFDISSALPLGGKNDGSHCRGAAKRW